MLLLLVNTQCQSILFYLWHYFLVYIYAGVTIIIPAGAIPEGVQQEVYFKVCQDNSILPPLDKDKGELLFFTALTAT